jgi:hypothetical protein
MKIAIQAHPRASISERGKPIHDEKPDRLGQPCDMNAFRPRVGHLVRFRDCLAQLRRRSSPQSSA